jgi:hypothetical protein
MDYIVFARWFGVVSVVLSLGILFNLEDARKMAQNMVEDESGYIMGGVLPVIFGSLALVLVGSYSIGWNLVVTMVGGGMMAIGIYRMFFVDQWKRLISSHLEQIPFLFSLFGLMLGVILLYIGYIAKAFEFTIPG